MRRLMPLLIVLAVALPAPVALAQQQQQPGSPFGPLPPAAPTETATPEATPTVEQQSDTDRTLLYVIGAGLLVLFVVIGRVITRDARKTLHLGGGAERPKLRDQGPHRHARQAKAKARAKTKAQRRARRQNR
jgi:hypothetical protein